MIERLLTAAETAVASMHDAPSNPVSLPLSMPLRPLPRRYTACQLVPDQGATQSVLQHVVEKH